MKVSLRLLRNKGTGKASKIEYRCTQKDDLGNWLCLSPEMVKCSNVAALTSCVSLLACWYSILKPHQPCNGEEVEKSKKGS